ncbi:hypothetical protein [Actinomadura coerulea]|uniref:hypothetical protein n=1 Tax=Actinomadura coerulea TaxID=46159 RepID=UPI00343029BC
MEDLEIASQVFHNAAEHLLYSIAGQLRAEEEPDQLWMRQMREATGAADDAILAALVELASDLLEKVQNQVARQTPDTTPCANALAEEPTVELVEQTRALAELGTDAAKIRYAVDHLDMTSRPLIIARWLEERGAFVARENIRSVLRTIRAKAGASADASAA